MEVGRPIADWRPPIVVNHSPSQVLQITLIPLFSSRVPLCPACILHFEGAVRHNTADRKPHIALQSLEISLGVSGKKAIPKSEGQSDTNHKWLLLRLG